MFQKGEKKPVGFWRKNTEDNEKISIPKCFRWTKVKTYTGQLPLTQPMEHKCLFPIFPQELLTRNNNSVLISSFRILLLNIRFREC